MFTISGVICLVVLIVIILSIIGVSIWLCKEGYIVEGLFIGPMALGLLGFMLMVFTVPIVGGLGDGVFPRFVDGEQIGYITNLSEEGIIWKTYEGEVHLGSGTQTAVGDPWDFSITRDRKDLFNKAVELQGRKVKIKYYGWFQMPFRMGWTGNEVQSIELFE